MLTDFFLKLREGGVPASVKEYLTLMEALQKHVSSGSLDDFFPLALPNARDGHRHFLFSLWL